jgi:hypothetical protein
MDKNNSDLKFFFNSSLLNAEIEKRRLTNKVNTYIDKIEIDDLSFSLYVSIDFLIKYIVLRDIQFNINIFENELDKLNKYMDDNSFDRKYLINEQRIIFNKIIHFFT